MISIVCGKPRGGKSYYAVLQFCQELKTSKRYIVTNLPLDMEAVAEWAAEQCDMSAVEVKGRVRLLTDAECYRFWLFDPEGQITGGQELTRGEICKTEWVQRGNRGQVVEQAKIWVPDFSRRQEKDYPGVLYIIDEAHVFFNARQTLNRSDEMTYFMSQHGHLRCDVIFVSQHPAKLDKHIRLDAQDYTVCSNLGNERGYMGVSLTGIFRRSTYQDLPSQFEKPETGTYRLKAKEFGKLYSTSAGVGLAGRVDTKESKKGHHWSRWLVPVGVGAVVILVLPTLVLKAIAGGINGGLTRYLNASSGLTTNAVKSISGSLPAAPVRATAPTGSPFVFPTSLPGVTNPCVTGVMGTIGVCLEDGRVLMASEGWEWRVERNGVRVAGLGLFPWAAKPLGSWTPHGAAARPAIPAMVGPWQRGL